MKRTWQHAFIVVMIGVFILHTSVYAVEYSLPRSSFLPGQLLYRISRNLDRVRAWFVWTPTAAVRYHLSLADKYLVEAETLFQNKRYPYAMDALERSNLEFERIPGFLTKTEADGANTELLKDRVRTAADAHVTVLISLEPEVPEVDAWTDENGEFTEVRIREQLMIAQGIRKSAVRLMSE